MAAVLAGAGARSVAALRLFGWELGIAFQIADDVLDVVGDEAQLGKPAGSDLCQGVLTLPVLYYLDRARDRDPVTAVLSGQRDEAHVQAALGAIGASGAIEAALADARVHIACSQEALAPLPDHPSRRALAALAEYVVARQR
jgi:geranylgeranyl pyrophosphate synthase